MKFTYIANYRLPTEKAHGIQIAKTCEALGKLVDLTLVYPTRKNYIKEDLFGYYGIERTFKTQVVKCPDFSNQSKLPVLIKSLISSLILSFKSPSADVYYTRDELVAFLKNAVLELHKFSKIKQFLYPKRIVAISGILKNELNGDVIVARDGVDLEMFNVSDNKGDLILYTGQTWKGNKMPDNLTWVKNKPLKEIPKWLSQAKILILPNNNKDPYTSPMKMFEYMASGRPIVASNIPAIREVLNENNAMLVRPDCIDKGIQLLLNDEELGKRLAKQARIDVEQYTLDKRAEKIIEFIKK